MQSSIEQLKSTLTADLTEEQDVSLADLNSSAMDVAKEIKKEGMTPARVKTALDIVGKMSALYYEKPLLEGVLCEANTLNLGAIHQPLVVNDFFAFANNEKGFAPKNFIYNQHGKVIGKKEGYNAVKAPIRVGNNIVFHIQNFDSTEGIVIYDGKHLEHIPLDKEYERLFIDRDYQGEKLFFKARNLLTGQPPYDLLNENGNIVESDPDVLDYGPIKSFSDDLYYAVSKLIDGKVVEYIRSRLNTSNHPFTDATGQKILVDEVIDIIQIPNSRGNKTPDTYAQVKKDNSYYFIDSRGTRVSALSETQSKLIRAKSPSVNGTVLFYQYKNKGKWFVGNSLGEEVGVPEGYNEGKDFQSINNRVAFRARDNKGYWNVIYDGKIIGGFNTAKGLTSINGEFYFLGKKTINSNMFIYNEKGEPVGESFGSIKHLTDVDGNIVFCAQSPGNSTRWRVYGSSEDPCSREFDDIFSIEPTDNPSVVKVFGQIAAKYTLELVNINETFSQSTIK